MRRGVFGCWGGGRSLAAPSALALPPQPCLQELLQGCLAWPPGGTGGLSLCPQHRCWEGRLGLVPTYGVLQGLGGLWQTPHRAGSGLGRAGCLHRGCSPGWEEGGAWEVGVNFTIKLVKSVQSPFCLLVQGRGWPTAPVWAGPSTRPPPVPPPRQPGHSPPAVCPGGDRQVQAPPRRQQGQHWALAAHSAQDAAACSPAVAWAGVHGAHPPAAPLASTASVPLSPACSL